ncbi:hypothetical protein BDK51DRAFT_28722 [Blyttiomyces helicus]|uniref:Galactose oxidase n=1 Tax=Blyttiomyces helicus TaxID=388810 RepID=A0A4P9WLU5_9FUNG|nr:hypothetical protein BDK51DRAFT_28722 [Blyttiomyces helicus]|eukprot:RKO92608.1 hypothetical protein BDK51DRAFT_28722 [Blyttiomyces helicus]
MHLPPAFPLAFVLLMASAIAQSASTTIPGRYTASLVTAKNYFVFISGQSGIVDKPDLDSDLVNGVVTVPLSNQTAAYVSMSVPASWPTKPLTASTLYDLATCTADVAGAFLYCFGGYNATAISVMDLTSLTWTYQIQTRIPPRGYPSMVTVGSKIYIWSGITGSNQLMSDLWMLDLSTPTLGPPLLINDSATSPGGRVNTCIAPLDPDTFLVYGGGDEIHANFSDQTNIFNSALSKEAGRRTRRDEKELHGHTDDI